MIVVLAMAVTLKDLVMRIPIVRMLREQKEERSRTADLIREMKQQQAENDRRVQVLDWMTYPHTNKRAGNHESD